MAIVPRVIVDQTEIERSVSEVAAALNPADVRDLKFTLDVDASGNPAIFFRVLLTKASSRDSKLGPVTRKVSEELFNRLQPFNRWGLSWYVDFTDNPAHHRNPNWS
jgi:hypothetical protein